MAHATLASKPMSSIMHFDDLSFYHLRQKGDVFASVPPFVCL